MVHRPGLTCSFRLKGVRGSRTLTGLSPNGRTLAAVGNDTGGTYLWDTRTGRRLAGPDGDAVAFSQDGRLVAIGRLEAAVDSRCQ
jgi:WD40 repeat protein